MSTDPKAATVTDDDAASRLQKGVKIFTYPKLIFIFPTMVMCFVCWLGMLSIKDNTLRPSSVHPQLAQQKEADIAKAESPLSTPDFRSTQNMLALSFLIIFGVNVLVMSFDFPRFAVVAAILVITTLLFFLLWLGIYVDWVRPLFRVLDGFYLAANSGFYFFFGLILLAMYGIIFTTRWLNYWEFLPNEILHHHGPWSDLERFPTMNLKFDKEIPDVFEHFLFGSGRLVFHVQNENKSIVLDNVMAINRKEEALKRIMSRMAVRITTDQEADQP